MDRHITIRGRRYRLRYKRLPANEYGRCDAPDTPDKCIDIRKGIKGRQELDTLIHEMLHAAFWDMDEDAIHDAAHDIALALWRIGYRKHP
jgi:hypothetical protein